MFRRSFLVSIVTFELSLMEHDILVYYQICVLFKVELTMSRRQGQTREELKQGVSHKHGYNTNMWHKKGKI